MMIAALVTQANPDLRLRNQVKNDIGTRKNTENSSISPVAK